jgi:hypothetical protein
LLYRNSIVVLATMLDDAAANTAPPSCFAVFPLIHHSSRTVVRSSVLASQTYVGPCWSINCVFVQQHTFEITAHVNCISYNNPSTHTLWTLQTSGMVWGVQTSIVTHVFNYSSLITQAAIICSLAFSLTHLLHPCKMKSLLR